MEITSKQELTPQIIEAVKERTIYWSDDRLCHWFFDFKIGDRWISSKYINNELTVIDVTVIKKNHNGYFKIRQKEIEAST